MQYHMVAGNRAIGDSLAYTSWTFMIIILSESRCFNTMTALHRYHEMRLHYMFHGLLRSACEAGKTTLTYAAAPSLKTLTTIVPTGVAYAAPKLPTLLSVLLFLGFRDKESEW